MAPPRHFHHQNSNPQHTGANGSPFPPLGLAAASAAISSSPLHSTSAFSSSNGSSNDMTQTAGDSSTGLPPAPTKVDASQAQACRLQDAYWSDEEEDLDCPLCLEEIDLSDANFKPCPCGYQICRFCWHHIKENLNGRCPACRRKYSDTSVEFKAMSQDEIKRLAQAKKQKEREKKDLEQMNRKHLANMRVVQKNLVYVVGLDPKLAKEELIPTLRSNEFFGQYGRISKILISKRTTASKLVMGTQESAIGVYVTYVRKEDAARAIIAIDGSKGTDGKTIRGSYGTTKYCTTYLRNLPCTNAICTYLHEPGEEADSFTKEDLSTLRHAAKDTEHKSRPTPTPASFSTSTTSKQQQQQQQQDQTNGMAVVNAESLVESSALPKTASWASGKPVSAVGSTGAFTGVSSGQSIAQTQIPGGGGVASNNAIRDQELPPLSALQQSSITRKGSGQHSRFTAATTVTPSPAVAKAPMTPKRLASTTTLASGEMFRSESPKPTMSTASPISSSVTLPPSVSSTPPPPGLSKQLPKGSSGVTASDTINGHSSSASKNNVEEATVTAVAGGEKGRTSPMPPSLPPGLIKRGSMISSATASRPATPSLLHESTTSLSPSSSTMASAAATNPAASTNATASSSSTYQPSSEAQAILDDMRSRREAESYQPIKSPFPDFDATLSSFGDGDDFCFIFEEAQIPANLKNHNSGRIEGGGGRSGLALGAFTPFASTPQGTSYFGTSTSTPPPPPPPGIATPLRSTTASPAPPPGLFGHYLNGSMNSTTSSSGYTGRFDPFAPDVVEIFATLKTEDHPFASSDQTEKKEGERTRGTVGGTGGGENGQEEKEEDEARLSRFGFSKRRESPFFKTHDDLLGFVKGGAARMTGEGEQASNNESASWWNDLQKRSATSQGGVSGNTSFKVDQGSPFPSNHTVSNQQREDPLLAQLMNNYRPPHHDPAIMSFTRHQQLQQQQAQQQPAQQQPSFNGQDAYGSSTFNPFETSQSTTPNYRSGNQFPPQSYGSHRTFA
ncbi:hypothetical protein CBS101457_004568 [Exobasidium rhododendri]|nr:hypothetical protein CBS101457_004568 [Exobasidium rhododendri]